MLNRVLAVAWALTPCPRLLVVISSLRSRACCHRHRASAELRPVSRISSRTFHGVAVSLAAGLGGELGHAGAQGGQVGEDLLVVAEQAEDLQPPALVEQLGPGSESGLAGVLDLLVGRGEGVAQSALVPQ